MHFGFDVTLSDKDYYEFNRFHMRETKGGRKTSLVTYVILAVIFVLVSVTTFLQYGFELYSFIYIAVWLFAVVLISLILDPVITPLILRLTIFMMKKSGKLPYEKLSRLEFYDEYFIEISENNKNETKYAGIEQVLVSRAKAVYIYLSGSTAYILPAIIFSSDSEREEFTEFIKAKHQENKKAG